jgi:rubrerythrin
MVDNLIRALEEEAKNIQKYLAYVERARAEGKPHVARLFQAVADSECIHAREEMRLLSTVKSTAENLRDAVDAEEFEFQEVYAQFLREAVAEKNEELATVWRNIMAVERNHYDLFQDAIKTLEIEEDLPEQPVYNCNSCGNTVIGKPSGPCEVCGAPADQFVEVVA